MECMRLIKNNTVINKFVFVLVLLLGVYVVFGATSNVDPNIGYYEDPYGNNVDYYDPYDPYDPYGNNAEESIFPPTTDNYVRNETPITEEEIEDFCSTLDVEECIEGKLCEPKYYENFDKCVNGQQLITEEEMENFCSTLDVEGCIKDIQCEPGYIRTWQTLFLFESFDKCVSLNIFEVRQQLIMEEEIEDFCSAFGVEECIKDRLCEPKYYKSFDKCVKGQQPTTEEEIDKEEIDKKRESNLEMVNQSLEDEFGYAVASKAADGIILIAVGAPGDDEVEENTGAVYVFGLHREKVWFEKKILAPEEFLPGDGFGHSVEFVDEHLYVNSRSGRDGMSIPIVNFSTIE